MRNIAEKKKLEAEAAAAAGTTAAAVAAQQQVCVPVRGSGQGSGGSVGACACVCVCVVLNMSVCARCLACKQAGQQACVGACWCEQLCAGRRLCRVPSMGGVRTHPARPKPPSPPPPLPPSTGSSRGVRRGCGGEAEEAVGQPGAGGARVSARARHAHACALVAALASAFGLRWVAACAFVGLCLCVLSTAGGAAQLVRISSCCPPHPLPPTPRRKRAKVSEWDAVEPTPAGGSRWDATPGLGAGAETPAWGGETPGLGAGGRWDATPGAAGGATPGGATPGGATARRNRWDTTPAHVSGCSVERARARAGLLCAAVSGTPRPRT